MVGAVTTMPAIPESERLRFKMRQSPVTAGLIITFIVVWVATWFDMDHVIFLKFAKVNDEVRAGELWRLFTASFLHAGVMHIWFNGMALASVGPAIERVYGRVRYLAAFLLGGAAGMLASVVFTSQPSVGASAGVFALLGVLLAYAVRSGRALPPRARTFLVFQVLFVVGLNVVLGLLAAFIDNAAHLGGLLAGFALGLVLRPRSHLVPASVPLPTTGAGSGPNQGVAAATRCRPGRSYLGWAGQRWKMIAMLLGAVPFVVSMFRSSGYFPGWELLAFFVGAGIAVSARCPGCKVRVFWWCVSKLPSSKGLDTAFRSENCPVCGYPDALPGAQMRAGGQE
jgi:membrane associated rhomboid family serine protease